MAYDPKEQVFLLESPNVAAELTRYVGLQLEYMHTYQGRTYTSMAEEVGVHPATISRIARGKSFYPQVRTVFPILGLLDMKFDARRKAIILRASRKETNVVKLVDVQWGG